MNTTPRKKRVAGLVVTCVYKDNWFAKALSPTGREIDSSAREGRINAVNSLLRFLPGWNYTDFAVEKISDREYHYVPRFE